jgi:general secretion pathway protein D
VTLNFVNADVEAVTRAIAAMIDRQIVVDPRVKGTITVYSEAFQHYLAALRCRASRWSRVRRPVQGGARGRRQAAGRQRERVARRRPGRAAGGQIVTQIFKLNTRTRTTWCRCCAR